MSDLLLVSTGGAIVDVVVVVIILLLALLGLKKGFVKTFIGAFGSIISLILAVVLCKFMANFLQNKFNFVLTVSNGLEGFFTNIFGTELMESTLGEVSQGKLALSGVPALLISIVLSIKGSGSLPQDVAIKNVIPPICGYYIVLIISGVALFILFRVAFFLVGEVIKKAHKFKPIAKADMALGAVLGLVRGIFYVCVVLLILNFIPLGFIQNTILPAIDSSVITNFINQHNILQMIVGALSNIDIISIIKTKIL